MRTLAALLILVAIAASQPAHLCSLVGKALALQGDPEVPCSLEFIQPYSKDLIALSGTQGDNSDQRLGHLKDVFNDRLYLTFQDPSIDLPLSSISRRMEVPMVVTHPVYYLTPDQANLQRTLTAIRLNKPIEQLSSDEVAPLGAYFTTQAEMQRRFSGIQSALERTQEIAERCRFDLPLGVANMPKVPMPDGMTQSQYLRQKANREERRGLFDERLPFQCGLLLPERKPIIYTPTEDGGWKNNTSGCVIPHEQLQNYLKRYQFI